MQYSTHLLRHFRLTIGHNIRTLRTKQNMPLKKLSRLTFINESRLDQFELGKNEMQLSDLFKIACALSVETKNLLDNQ